MVVSGLASPLAWSDETTRQFDLAVEAATSVAAIYHGAGFAVAIDGAIEPAAMDRRLADAGLADAVVGISLEPALAVALQRNRDRATKGFDTSILEDVIRQIDTELRTASLPPGWHRVDNGGEEVGQTVDRILGLAAEG
jgi:hypothetical protein